MSTRRCALVLASCLLLLSRADAAESLGFTVPDGFEVSLYADDALASDIYTLTTDAKGRVVVAGRGYVKILEDTRGTGKADRATLFSDVPKTGARGPDGWYYMICGNNAGIGPEHCKGPGSLIKKPNSGALVRFSPDGKTTEVVADGFRNPYDLDFDRFGRMFTVDSDGERIYRLPWYTPCRLYDIAPGMHHGWLLPGWGRSWARPAYFPDNVERLVEIGRGSPTGVLVYRHHAFPEKYRDGVFNLCWTFGRLYFFPLKPKGASYEAKMEVFLQSKGDEGFAPVDMAVGPDGDLFIAIGGRGTRGAVYRVHYKGELPKRAAAKDAVREVLQAPQPLSSWSRAKWVPAAKKLGKEAFVKAAEDWKGASVDDRVRAVEVLTEVFEGLPLEDARRLAGEKTDTNVRARAIWAISRTGKLPDSYKPLLSAATAVDASVARAAWEAFLALPVDELHRDVYPPWSAGQGNSERRVRAAATALAHRKARHTYQRDLAVTMEWPSERYPQSFCSVAVNRVPELQADRFKRSANLLHLFRDDPSAPRLETVRFLQISLGDLRLAEEPGAGRASFDEGYAGRATAQMNANLRNIVAQKIAAPQFPSGDRPLDLELARLLGMLAEEVPELLERLAAKWDAKSEFSDDIHYLIVSAHVPGARSPKVTEQTAHAVSNLIIKLAADGARPGDQMPGFLEELWDALVKRDPTLPTALVTDPTFGVPGHELFAARMPKEQQVIAAHKLLAAIKKLDEDRAAVAWSPELVKLVTALPDAEALPVLREQAAEPRFADSIALILAAKRQPVDRARLVEALGSSQEKVVASSAEALLAIAPEKATAQEMGAAIKSLRRFGAAAKDPSPRAPLAALIERWSGQKFADAAKPEAAYLAANAWFTKTHPKEAAALGGMAGADAEAWKKRFDKVDWALGDIKRGERVFQGKCARCHGATGRLGPDLSGVGQRFSREDLFTAILDPSKDILPAFQPTRIVTKAGKTYNGLLIFQSAEATLLQTTPDTTVRINQGELLTMEPGKISFMPTGLLDDAKDADLGDLYAYLKSLKKQ